MAEKEERILIARSTDYTITDTDKGALFEGEIAPHCANVFTRQEAIDKMCEGWNKLREQINADKEHAHCCSNKMIMEAALNALLGE